MRVFCFPSANHVRESVGTKKGLFSHFSGFLGSDQPGVREDVRLFGWRKAGQVSTEHVPVTEAGPDLQPPTRDAVDHDTGRAVEGGDHGHRRPVGKDVEHDPVRAGRVAEAEPRG